MRLPVIVGFGGINAAGRSSLHHAYRRMVIDALSPEAADHTWASLAALMGIPWDESDATRQQLALGTLVRRIEPSWFDVDQVPWNQPVEAEAGAQPISFKLATKWLPRKLPASWRVTPHQRIDGAGGGGPEPVVPAARYARGSGQGRGPVAQRF